MFRARILLVLALMLLLAVPMGTAFAQQAPAFEGTAVISDGKSKSDTITITLTNAAAPNAGREYVAWLTNDAGTERVSLGVVAMGAGGAGALTFGVDSPGYNAASPANLAKYNRLIISSEAAASNVTTPTGAAVYFAVIPLAASEHIGHLLIAWPVTTQNGILTNLKDQLTLARTHANLAYNSTTMALMQTHSHHVVNIIEGTTGPNFAASFGNPGDGQGVLLYASDRKHAGFAATVAPGVAVIAQHAALVEGAGKNAETYAILGRNEAIRAYGAPDLIIARFSLAYVIGVLNNAIIGLDANADGTITAQEGGAETAYREAQLMNIFTLQTGTVPPPGVVTPPKTPGTGDTVIPIIAQIALVFSGLFLAGGAVAIVGSRRRKIRA